MARKEQGTRNKETIYSLTIAMEIVYFVRQLSADGKVLFEFDLGILFFFRDSSFELTSMRLYKMY